MDMPAASGRPKLLQAIYSGLGGHGSVAFSLLRGDRDAMVEHALLFHGIEETRREYLVLCDELGIEADSVLKRPGLDLVSWARVFRSLQRLAPDLVVLHVPSLLLPAIVDRWLRGTRVIVVDHQSNEAKSFVEWVWMAASLLTCRPVVLLTDDAQRGMRKVFGRTVVDARTVVINNGIDLGRFAAREHVPDRDPKIIGMQSRFVPTKDHATLIRAFAILEHERPGAARLRLAGEGMTLEAARALVRAERIEHVVEFVGMLDEDQLIDFLHRVDVYVHSSNAETMSTAVMQSMAIGLPVVASDIPGLNDMVSHGIDGVLVPPGDSRALARELRRLLDSHDERVRLAAAARHKAERLFSQEQMFAKYATVLGVCSPAAALEAR